MAMAIHLPVDWKQQINSFFHFTCEHRFYFTSRTALICTPKFSHFSHFTLQIFSPVPLQGEWMDGAELHSEVKQQ